MLDRVRGWVPSREQLTQLARTEGRWVVAITATVLLVAGVTANHGAVAWLLLAAALYSVRPARRVWRWTKPRRDAIVPDAAGARGLYEKWRPAARARGTAARLEERWFPICREAKWTRGTGDAERAPSLIYCRADGDDTIALAWRPWINDAETTWAKQADTVKQALGAQTVRWWSHPEDSGVLEVRIGITPLPRRVELTAPPPPVTPDEHLAVYIGPRAGGGDAVWRPTASPHTFINGETGGGKGVILRLILAQVVPSCRGLIINPKGAGEFAWVGDAPGWSIVEIEVAPDATEAQVTAAENDLRSRIVTALAHVNSERIRRQVQIRRAGADNWYELPPRHRPTPFFVVFDEVAEACADDGDADTQRMGELLARLARLARSAGIFLVLAAQRGDVGTLGPQGGQLRSQLTGFLAVGGIDDTGIRMLTRGRMRADISALSQGIKGRALAARLDSEGAADVCVVQVAFLSQAAAAGAVGARLSGQDAGRVSEVDGSERPTPLRSRGGGAGSGSDVSDTGSDRLSGRGGAAPAAPAGEDGVRNDERGAQASAAPEQVSGSAEPAAADDHCDGALMLGPGPAASQGDVITLAEAAERLGITYDAARKRAKRGAGVTYVDRGKVRITA